MRKRKGEERDVLPDLVWRDFEQTGDISYYLLYKQLMEKQ